ncbi:MAG: 1,2-phenylacetyl-CoA epoxidase subunit PaaD [Actinomycetota bacterium]
MSAVETSVVEARVRAALEAVVDPEIPSCRIVDLGIVEDVRVSDDTVEIDLLPTFIGCPALDVIRSDVQTAVATPAEGRVVRVRFLMDRPWTTDRITDRAKAAMAEVGIAPPGDRTRVTLVQIRVPCPYCGAPDTSHESTFGPTLCRSIRYCTSCRNPIEAFKPK